MSASKSVKTKRVDELLVLRGMFDDVDDAKRACFAGEISSPDVQVLSPSQKIPVTATLNVKRKSRFVSRGGDKLSGALLDFGYNPSGQNCVDVGASTGGFTDCLLQNGAARVAAVDVAHSQLAWSLRNNERVSVFDRTNIKDVSCTLLGGPFDLLVADLSFISVAQVLPIFNTILKRSGFALIMVKPQFEIGKNLVGDGGTIRKPQEHINVLEATLDALDDCGFEPLGLSPSKVPGKKKGNLEFFILAGIKGYKDLRPKCHKMLNSGIDIDIEAVVKAAHEQIGVR